uniref:Uncharacterized protein n=2 Tax=Noctiluca scintillans TaxID=2966 RepID=A0A7S1A3H5_NOCSC|mmetsp:Transcript_29404/g.77718  ORF Transcript_29404/g.77718 Transcript_29404/m.77718 type:complete len:1005 (+) Transcript_29404:73-3087(+)
MSQTMGLEPSSPQADQIRRAKRWANRPNPDCPCEPAYARGDAPAPWQPSDPRRGVRPEPCVLGYDDACQEDLSPFSRRHEVHSRSPRGEEPSSPDAEQLRRRKKAISARGPWQDPNNAPGAWSEPASLSAPDSRVVQGGMVSRPDGVPMQGAVTTGLAQQDLDRLTSFAPALAGGSWHGEQPSSPNAEQIRRAKRCVQLQPHLAAQECSMRQHDAFAGYQSQCVEPQMRHPACGTEPPSLKHHGQLIEPLTLRHPGQAEPHSWRHHGGPPDPVSLRQAPSQQTTDYERLPQSFGQGGYLGGPSCCRPWPPDIQENLGTQCVRRLDDPPMGVSQEHLDAMAYTSSAGSSPAGRLSSPWTEGLVPVQAWQPQGHNVGAVVSGGSAVHGGQPHPCHSKGTVSGFASAAPPLAMHSATAPSLAVHAPAPSLAAHAPAPSLAAHAPAPSLASHPPGGSSYAPLGAAHASGGPCAPGGAYAPGGSCALAAPLGAGYYSCQQGGVPSHQDQEFHLAGHCCNSRQMAEEPSSPQAEQMRRKKCSSLRAKHQVGGAGSAQSTGDELVAAPETAHELRERLVGPTGAFGAEEPSSPQAEQTRRAKRYAQGRVAPDTRPEAQGALHGGPEVSTDGFTQEELDSMLRSGQAVSAEGGPWQEEPSSPDAAQMRRAKRHGSGVSRSQPSNGSAWVQSGGVGNDSARGCPGGVGNDVGRGYQGGFSNDYAPAPPAVLQGDHARGCVEAWPESSAPTASSDGLNQQELDTLSWQHGYQTEPPDSPDSPQAQKILNAKRKVQAQSSYQGGGLVALPEAVGSVEGLTQGELDSLAQGSSPTNERSYIDDSFASRSASMTASREPAGGLTQDELDALARQFSPTGVQPDSPDSPMSQQILNSKRQVQARSPPFGLQACQEGASQSLSSQALQSQGREICGSGPSYHGAHPSETCRSAPCSHREPQEEPWSSQDGLTQRELDSLAQASSPIHAERTWSDSRTQPGLHKQWEPESSPPFSNRPHL